MMIAVSIGRGLAIGLASGGLALVALAGGSPNEYGSAVVDPSDGEVKAAIVSEGNLKAPMSASMLALGDQLKITVYERMSAPSTTGSFSNSATGLVERGELTGSYTIQEDGSIVIPMLGRVEAEARKVEDVALALEASFKGFMGREAKAVVILEDRQPIYVVGHGVRSGTIKYLPGMTVMHALARADISDESKGDAYIQLERLRERERLTKATQKLGPLLGKYAVLTAERSNEPAKVPSKLVSLVGSEKAASILDDEIKRRQAILDSRKPIQNSYEAAVVIAKQEVKNLDDKLKILDKLLQIRAERSGVVEGLRSRGTANAFFALQVKAEVSDLNERRVDVLSAMANANLKATQTANDLDRFFAEYKADLNQSIRSAEDDILDFEATIIASEGQINQLGVDRFTTGEPAFALTRLTRKGPVHLAADKMTLIRPGDLLEIPDANQGDGLNNDGKSLNKKIPRS